MNIKEIQKINCEEIIATKWNIYEWVEKHPDTTIAHALKRIEKIFDFSDAIQCGFSGGKDSTVSANLACLELNLRRLRIANNIDRYGNNRIDPLDAKWANKRIVMAMTDAEVVFTSTNNYAKRFLKRYGPHRIYNFNGKEVNGDDIIIFNDNQQDFARNIYNKVMFGENVNVDNCLLTKENCRQISGFDLIEFYWVCLPLAWQSGVSFDSGILISWDKSKRNMWVQEMPTKEDLHGFECLHEDNLKTANPIPLQILSPEAQKYHRDNGNVLRIHPRKLFNDQLYKNIDGNYIFGEEVEAVSNYGRGPVLQNFKPGCHEKEEQDDYSFWLAQTSWLIS